MSFRHGAGLSLFIPPAFMNARRRGASRRISLYIVEELIAARTKTNRIPIGACNVAGCLV